MQRLLTAEEVSEYLGVPVPTLYRWRHQGTGPKAFRVGRHLRYDLEVVRKWLEDEAA
jgi:excisionase family DNA binding protein